MKIGEKLHGFTVNKIQPVETINSIMIEMSHDKTGARLIWMKNDEENKLFSIAFKTIPTDDTGVFHILEHSVLSGSKKYPVKEPFLDLMKSSMNTFLNAMTFPDKTVFPVSSRNDTDFMNLTKVYLDAVFNPAIYDNPCIFQQEGWHIELDASDDTASYKGVVFNEMKGALSSVYRRISREMDKMLFPDNCYRFESGGDPEAIPDLTYEQFLKAHAYFYHPTNAYIYLDGALDIDAVLSLLDTEYLSRYERSDDRYDIPWQEPIAAAEKRCDYEISPQEPKEKRTHYVWGKILGTWHEPEKIFAATVLGDALTATNDSPLKRALLNTGFCMDASLGIYDGILQPYGVLEIQNTDYENCRQLTETVQSVLKELTEKGIEREDLEAAINRLEFRYREGSEPKGLDRNFSVLTSWIHGGDPLLYIDCDGVFAFLREQLTTDYYEKLLADWLIDETGRATLYMIPSHTYGAELREREEKRLNDIQKSWTEEERQAVFRENQRLERWQLSEDTPEQIATLPKLPLSEVNAQPMPFPTEISKDKGYTLLQHPAKEKGIISLNLYFSLADCTEEEISLLAVLSDLLGNLPTTQHDGISLQRKITSLLGGLSFSVDVFSKQDQCDTCQPFFEAKTRFLAKNKEEALALVGEILAETVFDHPDLIKELLLQCEDDFKQGIIASGHQFALRRARASLSAESSLIELTSGYAAYQYLRKMVENIEEQMGDWIETFQKLQKRIFCTKRLTVGVTAAEALPLPLLTDLLPEGEAPRCEALSYRMQLPKAQGILIPASVSYSGFALPVAINDKGTWNVLSTILSLEYLWNEVRVQGGAYGAGATLNALGEAAFYSYRDPSPANSLSVYGKTADFLRQYCREKPSLDSYIISTIAKQEPLLSDGVQGAIGEEQYFRGITWEQRVERRRHILSLTNEDLLAACDNLSRPGVLCVVGSEEALKVCESYGLTVESI